MEGDSLPGGHLTWAFSRAPPLGSGTPWPRILESKLPSLSATRWGPLAGLQVSGRPGTLELALQLPLLLFGSVHKKALAPPPAPPSRPHAPTAPPTTHTHPPQLLDR